MRGNKLACGNAFQALLKFSRGLFPSLDHRQSRDLVEALFACRGPPPSSVTLRSDLRARLRGARVWLCACPSLMPRAACPIRSLFRRSPPAFLHTKQEFCIIAHVQLVATPHPAQSVLFAGAENSPLFYQSIFSHNPRRIFRATKLLFCAETAGTFSSYSAAALPFFLSRSVSLLVVVPARLLAPLALRGSHLCVPAFSHDLLTNRKLHAKIKSHTSSTRRGVVGRVKCIIPPLSTFVKRGTLFFLSRTLPPSHGPPQKRLIRGPWVGVIAATSPTDQRRFSKFQEFR